MPDDRQSPFSYHSPEQKKHRDLGCLKWLVAVLALGGAVGGVYFGRSDLVRPYLEGTPLEPPRQVTTVYKWRGADGSWRYSETPPPAGTPYETIEANSDANILPSLKRD